MSSKSFTLDLQETVTVQLREDPVQVVVVIHDVVVKVPEEPGRDMTGRPGRNDGVEPPVVKGDGDL